MATAGGYRVEMHVIGDRAVDVALNALTDAHVAAEKRPVLIHCQVQYIIRPSFRRWYLVGVQLF